jgi:MoxR-like ATPase
MIDSLNYIPSQALNSVSMEFYHSLSKVQPPVPPSIFKAALDPVSHLGVDDLIELIVKHPESAVWFSAIDILCRRRIDKGVLARRLFTFCQKSRNDKRMIRSALAALGKVIQTEIHCGQFISRHQESVNPEKIVENAAELLECNLRLFYAERLLRIPGFRAKYPGFVVTNEAKQRLDEVCSALETGMAIVIHGRSGVSKSLTVNLATTEMFGDPPLVYGLSEGTRIADLLGRQQKRGMNKSVFSFIPGILTRAYKEGRVLLLEGIDICQTDVMEWIFSTFRDSQLEINGHQIERHSRFRLITTVNTDSDVMKNDLENVIPKDISRIMFSSLSRTECTKIFRGLFSSGLDIVHQITELHFLFHDYFFDTQRGSSMITIRNFVRTIALIESGGCSPRDACIVNYLAQIPRSERARFEEQMTSLGMTSSMSKVGSELTIQAKTCGIYPHQEFVDAAICAVLAARAGCHILLEGRSGVGLTTLAHFVAFCCCNSVDSDSKHREIPYLLLRSGHPVDSLIGEFVSESLFESQEENSDFCIWEEGPILKAAINGTPIILDGINEIQGQFTQRLNPILDLNSRQNENHIFIPEYDDDMKVPVKSGFVVIATLTLKDEVEKQSISFNLRNRFVTIAFESPRLTFEMRAKIAETVIDKLSARLAVLDIEILKDFPEWWGIRKTISKSDTKALAHAVATVSPETSTIKDISLIAHAGRTAWGVLICKTCEKHILGCQLNPEELESEGCANLVELTVRNPIVNQQFISKGDRKSPMWQLIAALSVCSATGVPLFVEGLPGCGKTEAVRYFSANRTFHDRIPVYSISCNAETSIEDFLGIRFFDQTGIRFVEGPLLQAVREGCIFLADNFPFLRHDVMTALIPFMEARVGDDVMTALSHREVSEIVRISPGFLFIATGNADMQESSQQISDSILSQFYRLKVSNPSGQSLEKVISEMIENDYPMARKIEISAVNIRKFVEILNDHLNVKWSLRTIRRFLRRVNEFVGYRPRDHSIPSEIREISVTDMALSLILSLPQIQFDKNQQNQVIDGTVECFGGSRSFASEFIESRTEYHALGENHYLVRGSIALQVRRAATFPQPVLDTLFWMRLSGTRIDDHFSENILLVGPTCYKSFALDYFMSESKVIYDFNDSTSIVDLIGSTSLQTSKQIERDKEEWDRMIRDNLTSRFSFHTENDVRRELEAEIGKQKFDEVSIPYSSYFIQCALEQKSVDDEERRSENSLPNVTKLWFSAGILTKCILLGLPVFFRSIHLLAHSVVDRLNSLLEDRRSFTLWEDTSRLFNNPDLLRRFHCESIPICSEFSIAATTTESGFHELSNQIQSRFTCIATIPYSFEIPRMTNSAFDLSDLRNIGITIVEGHRELVDEIERLYCAIHEIVHLDMTILEYVRLCKTVWNLFQQENLSAHSATGIAVLRTIVDRLPNSDRRRLTKEILQPYLPVFLTYIVVAKEERNLVFPCPIELVKNLESGKLKMKCCTSEIELPVLLQTPIDILRSVLWTQSFVDIADAVFTAVSAHTIAVFEGPPGRGKAFVSELILCALGLQVTRIKLSSITSIEDLFGGELVSGPLTLALERSCRDIEDQPIPSQAILFEQVNLANEIVLEELERFMRKVLEGGKSPYLLRNGRSARHCSIVIIATIDNGDLHNVWPRLSAQIRTRSHFLKLEPLTTFELEALANAILSDSIEEGISSQARNMILRAHRLTSDYLEREKNEISDYDHIVTLRDFARIRELRREYNRFETAALIELVYGSRFEPTIANDLLKKLEIESQFDTCVPIIREHQLLLTDLIRLSHFRDIPDGRAELLLTSEQLSLACKIGALIMAHRPVMLFGDTGSGKTYFVQTLADAIGMQLIIIQLHSEMNISAIIGTNYEPERISIEQEVQQLAISLLRNVNPPLISLAFAAAAFSRNFDLNEILYFLNEMVASTMNSVSRDTLVQIERLRGLIEIYNERSKQTIMFSEGPLLRAMREGRWILLDKADFCARVMKDLQSLLEEEPSFLVREGERNVFFHVRSLNRSKIEQTVRIDEFVEISPNFQLFVNCRNPQVFPAGFRSNCLSIRVCIRPTQETLREFAYLALLKFDKMIPHAVWFSECLTNAFLMADSTLLLSGTSFNLHRMVSCVRCLGSGFLNAASLFYTLRKSFTKVTLREEERQLLYRTLGETIMRFSDTTWITELNHLPRFNVSTGRLEFSEVEISLWNRLIASSDTPPSDECLQHFSSIVSNEHIVGRGFADLSTETMMTVINSSLFDSQSDFEMKVSGKYDVPQTINMDEIENEESSLLNCEILKGKNVEDLLARDWHLLERSRIQPDEQLALSEWQIFSLIDGTMDSPLLEVPEEIKILEKLSLQVQSVIYSAISSRFQVSIENEIHCSVVRNVEISILVDVSSSMTTLSPDKLMCAELLTVGISNVLSSFGVRTSYVAFADREAIWRLSDPMNHNLMMELTRVIDSLRGGGRIGSYPLDAIFSARQDWSDRQPENESSNSHLTIVISNFLSPQVLDRNLNWSELGLGDCFLLELDSAWDCAVLDEKQIPRSIYENGLIPMISASDSSIHVFRLNASDICQGQPSATNVLSDFAFEFSSFLVNTQASPSFILAETRVICVGICDPIIDPIPIWAELGIIYEKSNDPGKDIFFQHLAMSEFPLILDPCEENKIEKKLVLSDDLENSPKWFDLSGSFAGYNPFDRIAKDIATSAFSYIFARNRTKRFHSLNRSSRRPISISIVIDNVRRLFTPCNLSHTVITIAAIIGSFSHLSNSHDILVNLISSSSEGVLILLKSIRASFLSTSSAISTLLRTLERKSDLDSGLGCGCQAAIELMIHQNGFRMFVLTDGNLTFPYELTAFRKALIKANEHKIEILGIGLGISPFHLSNLFPSCVYSPNPSDLGNAIASLFGIGRKSSSAAISSRVVYDHPDPNRMIELRESLCSSGAKFCTGLGMSIKDRLESDDVFSEIGDPGLLQMNGPANDLSENPEGEPFRDGCCEGFHILIVCLYMGAYETVNLISKDIFMKGCGNVLEAKGFEYTFVCSYGEGISELTRNENGRCPYTQLWLFSSPGYGELPNEGLDKDTNKILPFLEAVNDFRNVGGSLLLFCDNGPYTFEANYLLEHYLIFSEGERTGQTKVRFGGLPCRGTRGMFYGWIGKEEITAAPTESWISQTFIPISSLPPPGRARKRSPLRTGLVKFYEGNTISYATNDDGSPITEDSNLWPFQPFAFTSEQVSPPRPFIVFHDAKITSDNLECPGPVVIHGGFTSAFSEFKDDTTRGTGRLIISIACWMVRLEERSHLLRVTGHEIAKSVPCLTGDYSVKADFNGFREKTAPTVPRYSILCLDESGSMGGHFSQLARAVNDYIRVQRDRGGIFSIIKFNDYATIVYEQGTATISEEDCSRGGTDFGVPLRVAIELIRQNPCLYECRILFFTDGCAGIPTEELSKIRTLGVRMDAIGYGSVNESILQQLVTCGGQVSLYRTMDDVQKGFRAIAAMD